MDRRHLTQIERMNCVVAAVLIAAAALLFDRRVAAGVAVGAVLSCANFWGMRVLMQRVMNGPAPRRVVFQIMLALKLGVLILLIFLALRHLPISAVGLVVGLSVFLFSIVVESFRFAVSTKVKHG